VWRDILMEGPAAPAPGSPEFWERRTRYVARFLGIDPDAYLGVVRQQADGLRMARNEDEVVLWFDADLFCVANLLFLLDWFATTPAPTLSLVMAGPGGLTAGLDEAFARRRRLGSPDLARGAEAWRAFADPDPRAIERWLGPDAASLPVLAPALRAHLRRFPSAASGLSEVEATVLARLGSSPVAFPALFQQVADIDPIRWHGMGDVQFAAYLRRMASGAEPLVKIDPAGSSICQGPIGRDDAFRRWTIAPTDLGREVREGRVDRITLNGIDSWLGGVRLHGHRDVWRWDTGRGALVRR
jgi:hypothetical protein